jgi:hypothetical protein
MKPLFPLALVAILFAIPAPTHRLSAEIRAGHAAPFRVALAYRLGFGKRLALDIQAGMTSGKGHPLRLNGDIALWS